MNDNKSLLDRADEIVAALRADIWGYDCGKCTDARCDDCMITAQRNAAIPLQIESGKNINDIFDEDILREEAQHG